MDISKLPKLSQTPAPAAQGDKPTEMGEPAVAAQAAWCPRCHAPNSAGATFCNSCGVQLRVMDAAPNVGPGIGAEVWVAAIVGIVLMLMGINFAKWGIATLAKSDYHTNSTWQVGEHAGDEVKYWDLVNYAAFQDMAIFLFGLAMVLEAIVLTIVHSRIKTKRPLLALAIAITLAATIMNLLLSAKLFSAGVMPILSLLCVGFGGYIIAYEWRLFKYFNRRTHGT
jgi:hypothetical protein